MLEFLHPAALLGVLSAAVPLVIHLTGGRAAVPARRRRKPAGEGAIGRLLLLVGSLNERYPRLLIAGGVLLFLR